MVGEAEEYLSQIDRLEAEVAKLNSKLDTLRTEILRNELIPMQEKLDGLEKQIIATHRQAVALRMWTHFATIHSEANLQERELISHALDILNQQSDWFEGAIMQTKEPRVIYEQWMERVRTGLKKINLESTFLTSDVLLPSEQNNSEQS